MLEGRAAIVTGAGSGIGEATARLFAEHGADVLAVDLDQGALRRAFGETGRIVPLVMDIATPNAPDSIVETARRTWGRIDILFNNAGVGARTAEGHYNPVADTTDEHWRRVIDINLTAQFRLTKAALPLLRESAAGRVIMTGSPLADRSYAGVALYTAAKAGLQGFTRVLAIEEGVHGVTANWVEPGGIVTAMPRHTFSVPETRAAWTSRSPIKRLGDPIDVANVALFLASDLSGFVTGQGIRVDGGSSLVL